MQTARGINWIQFLNLTVLGLATFGCGRIDLVGNDAGVGGQSSALGDTTSNNGGTTVVATSSGTVAIDT